MKRILLLLLFFVPTYNARPPNIVHIVADDLGWAQVGYHQPPGSLDVQTPNLDALAAGGLILDRLYTHTICSPSRCALQSGRAPIHVNVQNVVPEVYNPLDANGFQGMPLNMTTIGQLMKRGGYDTFFVGKYDVGMATPRHAPTARGYDQFFGYWHHANDYWSHAIESCPSGATMRDLWQSNSTHGGPAAAFANSPLCAQGSQNATPCMYEEALLAGRVQSILESRAPGAAPFFLVYAMHLVHYPLEVPQAYLDHFAFIDDGVRRLSHAMGKYLDDAVGGVVDTLRSLRKKEERREGHAAGVSQ